MNTPKITFDRILPIIAEILERQREPLKALGQILVNRDLNGRVRLIVDEKMAGESQDVLRALATEIAGALGPHGYPADQGILFEPDFDQTLEGEITFPLDGFDHVRVVDRLATESNWSVIAPPSGPCPRVVFYSIKGGVGRSTALAATAWALAEQGKRVLVLDLDLESPGLSSALLPADRRPAYGITDWLVEDLVNNGEAISGEMIAGSDLSRMGEIMVAPAHGANPGEYIAKLGRVWMPKVFGGVKEPWSSRLRRLVTELETRYSPDVVLIDSRAGIDEVASAIITGLGAATILLFAIDGDQTWNGYRMLCDHWRTAGVVREIRERLQVVAAMIPELGATEYFASLRENAWDLFLERLYDELPATSEGGLELEPWNFSLTEENAPHHPWPIRWHRGFAAMKSLYGTDNLMDTAMVTSVFGGLIAGVSALAPSRKE